MKTFQLSSGNEIPTIGLGTLQSKAELYKVAKHMLAYHHIDCAPIYNNQTVIGDILHQALQAGEIKREAIWVTSKLWNSYHRPEDVEPALKETLQELQLDYLDLYLIHWPVVFKRSVATNIPSQGDDILTLDEVPIENTWQAMELLIEKGLVRNIGVSNFSIRYLKRIMVCATIAPTVNQVECHPYLAQTELHQFCTENHIHMTAYSPLGSNTAPDNDTALLTNKVIQDIATRYQKTPAQIILAWQLGRGISVIPKSTHPARMQENLAAESIVLSPEDAASIGQLNKDHRYVDATFWEKENGSFKAAELWE